MVVLLSPGSGVVWCAGRRGPPTVEGPRPPHPSRARGEPLDEAGTEILYGDAHRPGGAGDDLLGLLEVVGVEVFHLGLRDRADLVTGDRGDLGLVRLTRALLHPGGLEQHAGCRRRLGGEVRDPG